MSAARPLGLGLRLYLALIAIFLLLPLAVVVIVAFSSASFVSFPPPALSLRWMTRVLSDAEFMRPLWNSLVLAVLSALGAAVLATPAALAIVRYRFRGAAEVQSVLLSPLSLPTLILSIALLFFLSRIGLGNSFAGLLAGHIVVTLPYLLRTIVAVYASVDREIELAAHTLGAGPWRTFLWVTLPAIRPAMVAGGLFAVLISFDEVAIALLLTNADTVTLPVSVLAYLVHNYDPAVAAISVVKMVLVIVVLLALERVFGLQRLLLPPVRKSAA